jgi:predicted Fe-S protein YdhL (DUF1289 family)
VSSGCNECGLAGSCICPPWTPNPRPCSFSCKHIAAFESHCSGCMRVARERIAGLEALLEARIALQETRIAELEKALRELHNAIDSASADVDSKDAPRLNVALEAARRVLESGGKHVA